MNKDIKSFSQLDSLFIKKEESPKGINSDALQSREVESSASNDNSYQRSLDRIKVLKNAAGSHSSSEQRDSIDINAELTVELPHDSNKGYSNEYPQKNATAKTKFLWSRLPELPEKSNPKRQIPEREIQEKNIKENVENTIDPLTSNSAENGNTDNSELQHLRNELIQMRRVNEEQKKDLEKWRERYDVILKYSGRISKKKNDLQDELSSFGTSANTPFYDPNVLHWLTHHESTNRFDKPLTVTVIGDMPINSFNWGNFLQSQGISIVANSPNVIVGKRGWEAGRLDEIVDNDYDDVLLVYSQELFIASLLSNKNPFYAGKTVLEKFAHGHEALEYLLTNSFEWPYAIDLEDLDSRASSFRHARAEESPLYAMAYNVARNGPGEVERREILHKAYTGKLVHVVSNEYMQEWGARRSRRRLWRIAHHIAMLIRANYNKQSFELPVEKWSADLDWLRIRYYKESMRFEWPYSERM